MKRHRVRLRPKARSRRRLVAGRAAGLGALLLLSGLAVTARPWERLRLPRAAAEPLARAFAVESVSVAGVPEGPAGELAGALGWHRGDVWGPFEPGRRAERLRERFRWVEAVGVSRSWLGKTVSFSVVPRGVVAAASGARRLGPGAAWLGEDGGVFVVPAGLAGGAGLPTVDLGGWPDGADLAPAARLVRAASAAGALPSRPVVFAYDAREKGWTVALEDGTRLVWGGLEWTPEKLGRLREVLADATPRFGRGFTADLRYFEDGRILVRK